MPITSVQSTAFDGLANDTAARPPAPSLPPIEVMPRDISGLARGNVGIDYVHRFESGAPGPHIAVVGLTHGNEFCGMTALTWLLDTGVRPVRGALTAIFANVAAYERFDPARPLDSRFIDRDFNRVWSDEILSKDDRSYEARRARELKPVIESADALLDLHSTAWPVASMLIYCDLVKSHRLVRALREPLTHVVTPGGKHQGGLLCEYGRLGREEDPALAVVVECGQHFAAVTGHVAIQATLRFLGHFGTIDHRFAAQHLDAPAKGEPVTYEITDVIHAKTEHARFARPLIGFEEFAKGELIALDGEEEIRAPFDRCAVLMPKPFLVKGREMMTLSRRV